MRWYDYLAACWFAFFIWTEVFILVQWPLIPVVAYVFYELIRRQEVNEKVD